MRFIEWETLILQVHIWTSKYYDYYFFTLDTGWFGEVNLWIKISEYFSSHSDALRTLRSFQSWFLYIHFYHTKRKRKKILWMFKTNSLYSVIDILSTATALQVHMYYQCRHISILLSASSCYWPNSKPWHNSKASLSIASFSLQDLLKSQLIWHIDMIRTIHTAISDCFTFTNFGPVALQVEVNLLIGETTSLWTDIQWLWPKLKSCCGFKIG